MNEASIKARLKNIADAEGRKFDELFKQLTFERFLARVANSKFRPNMIFKGGLCLSNYIETDRTTMDLDFLIRKIETEIEHIKKMFHELIEIDLEDAYLFSKVEVSILEIAHKQYPGFRIKLQANLGKMRDQLQIDIGIGDSVDEHELGLEFLKYKGQPLIEEVGVSVLAYPPEFIFSEKLQAIIQLEALNSRMKDYFDCYMLIEQNVMDEKKVRTAIEKTFSKRKTEIQLVKDYTEELGPLWSNFRKKVRSSPGEIAFIINRINDYLKKIAMI